MPCYKATKYLLPKKKKKEVKDAEAERNKKEKENVSGEEWWQ